MTIREQLAVMRAGLQDWVKSVGGTVVVASDPVSALDVLRSRPGAVSAAVVFTEETPRGAHSELGKVDRHYKLVLSRGRGFRVESGESLTDGTGGGKAMFELVEEGREILRGLRFVAGEGADPEDELPAYEGTGAFEVSGFVLDAYEVRIAVGAQLPVQE